MERGRKVGIGLDVGSPDNNKIRSLQSLIYRDRPPADPHLAICFLAGTLQGVLSLQTDTVSTGSATTR